MCGSNDLLFLSLRQLALGFEAVRTRAKVSAAAKEQLTTLAGQVGAPAMPLIVRRLRQGGDEESLWAFELLLELGRDDELQPRVVDALRETAVDEGASETARLMAIAMLSEIEIDPSELSDDARESFNESSVLELARHLESPCEVARAADHVAHELEPIELLELVDSLCRLAGSRAGVLVDELMVRDDVHEQVRGELARMVAPVRDRRRNRDSQQKRRPAVARVCLGEKPDAASRVLVASLPIAGSRPPRRRAICCALSDEGRVIDAMYREDFTPRGVEREIVRPLERDGFAFQALQPDRASELLAEAASATHREGHQLPRAFFLGRDILGLFDEHVTARRRDVARDHTGQLLARGLDLLADESPSAARPALERYRSIAPDDAEGAAALGSCLLAAGETDAAMAELVRATRLAPDEPRHHWTLAAAHHRAGRRPACYLALVDYLRALADGTEPAARVDQARDYTGEYERRARLDYPGVDPSALARADELVREADALVGKRRVANAQATLRRAVHEAPQHHGAWTRLGELVARTTGRIAEARSCIERALELAPNDPRARAALASLAPATKNAAPCRPARPAAKRKRPARTSRGAGLSRRR